MAPTAHTRQRKTINRWLGRATSANLRCPRNIHGSSVLAITVVLKEPTALVMEATPRYSCRRFGIREGKDFLVTVLLLISEIPMLCVGKRKGFLTAQKQRVCLVLYRFRHLHLSNFVQTEFFDSKSFHLRDIPIWAKNLFGPCNATIPRSNGAFRITAWQAHHCATYQIALTRNVSNAKPAPTPQKTKRLPRTFIDGDAHSLLGNVKGRG